MFLPNSTSLWQYSYSICVKRKEECSLRRDKAVISSWDSSQTSGWGTVMVDSPVTHTNSRHVEGVASNNQFVFVATRCPEQRWPHQCTSSFWCTGTIPNYPGYRAKNVGHGDIIWSQSLCSSDRGRDLRRSCQSELCCHFLWQLKCLKNLLFRFTFSEF